MSVNYQDVANVLDAVADYIDGIEYEKTAAEKAARDERINTLSTRYEHSTGEALPESLKEKLAGLDQETLDHILKVANNNGDSPGSMGGPSEIQDGVQPETVKEAADQAEDRFINWIIS